jgi:hypothetical protein
VKFIGLKIDNHVDWTNHTDNLIPKFSVACYAVRSMCHISATLT